MCKLEIWNEKQNKVEAKVLIISDTAGLALNAIHVCMCVYVCVNMWCQNLSLLDAKVLK